MHSTFELQVSAEQIFLIRFAALIAVPIDMREFIQRRFREQQSIKKAEHQAQPVPVTILVEFSGRKGGFNRPDSGQFLALLAAQSHQVPQKLNVFCKKQIFIVASNSLKIFPATKNHTSIHAREPNQGNHQRIGYRNS